MSDVAIRQGQGSPAVPPRRLAGALDDARRHTRHVLLLRRVLPGAAAALCLLIVLSGIDFTGGLPAVDVGPVKIDGSTVTMTNPELSGYGKNNEVYRVTAVRAEQDIKQPNLVVMEEIDGTLSETGGRQTTLSAAHGLYDTRNRTLVLERNVIVSSSSGYVAHLERADVDVVAGRVSSDRPVLIEGLDGTIRSDSVEFQDKGARIVFTGRVVLDVMLDPGKEDGAADEGKPQ